MKKALTVAVVGTVVAGLNLAAHTPAASAATATPAPVGFSTYGYGTYVSSSLAALQSGATAYSGVSCTTTPNLTNNNKVASVNLGKIGRVGADTSQSAASSIPPAAPLRAPRRSPESTCWAV